MPPITELTAPRTSSTGMQHNPIIPDTATGEDEELVLDAAIMMV